MTDNAPPHAGRSVVFISPERFDMLHHVMCVAACRCRHLVGWEQINSRTTPRYILAHARGLMKLQVETLESSVCVSSYACTPFTPLEYPNRSFAHAWANSFSHPKYPVSTSCCRFPAAARRAKEKHRMRGTLAPDISRRGCRWRCPGCNPCADR